MRLLNDLEAFERENSANQLQMRMIEGHVVALEFLVHRDLSSHADDVVEKERGDEERDDQSREERSDPHQNAMVAVSIERWRLGGHRDSSYLAILSSKPWLKPKLRPADPCVVCHDCAVRDVLC